MSMQAEQHLPSSAIRILHDHTESSSAAQEVQIALTHHDSSVREAKWTAATRRAYYKEHPENFAGPGDSYPIRDKSDVGDAWGLAGHADNPTAVRRKIIAIAKRLGFTDALPDSAKDFMKSAESDEPSPSKEAVDLSVRTKLATMTSCWLEDGAISLNGRQYPKEAVDRLIQSAQVQLSDPHALPLTCYLSHEDADRDRTAHLVGRITNVWREGTRALASIDIPPTTAGRDTVALVSGGYIRSQSLRASGAEMQVSPEHTFPQVGGASLKLEGIDFTTSPGLPLAARITDLSLAESTTPGAEEQQHPQRLKEIFTTHHDDLLIEQGEGYRMPELLAEAGDIHVTGDSPSTDGSPGGGAWAGRNLSVPTLDSNNALTGAPLPADHPTMEALRQSHDHLAAVLDSHLGPVHGAAQEAGKPGRRLMQPQCEKLVAAHDAIAKHAGMSCENAYEAALKKMAQPDSSNGNDGMQDGDDDDAQERVQQPIRPVEKQQENPRIMEDTRKMTTEEATRLLQSAGYKLTPPLTREQLLQQQWEMRLAEERAALTKQMDEQAAAQAKQFEEMKQLLTAQQQQMSTFPAPQRRSLVEGAAPQPLPQAQQRRPSYIQEQIRTADPYELLDRSRPLPDAFDSNLERVLAEYQKVLLGMVLLNPDGTLA